MKKILLAISSILFLYNVSGQQGVGFKQNYKLKHSGSVVADKIFYLITVIDRTPEVKTLLSHDRTLKDLLDHKLEGLQQHNVDSCKTTFCLLDNYKWSINDSIKLDETLRALYLRNHIPFDKMINIDLRSSGFYQMDINLSNSDFLLRAWGEYVLAVNNIIDQFGFGKKMRYPNIDSASYNTSSQYFKGIVRSMLELVGETSSSKDVFYEPSLKVALGLLDMNDRDEAGRLEPLELNENKKAVGCIRQTSWKNFKYAAIEVPGSGPDVYTLAISPICKIRCGLAAWRFKHGWAPFIIVSGGYAHPFHTPYCEAVQMKKYLMEKCLVPEAAIIIEPQARHTTTNLRNVNRLIFRYGIPTDKPCIFVSTKSQVDWVMDQLPNQNFDARCMRELGFLPYRGKQRISDEDMLFYPTLVSLQADAYDPLDP